MYEEITQPGATIALIREATPDYFDRLRDEIEWEQGNNNFGGRLVAQPRLTAWYGDPGMTYHYSGVTHPPLPWAAVLIEIKSTVEALLDVPFNSALLNYYRDGRDMIGFHSDSERELGCEPIIASLTYGAERRFAFRHKRGAATFDIPLPNCSLLVMAGATQTNWKHGIDRTTDDVGGRINITFRTIYQ